MVPVNKHRQFLKHLGLYPPPVNRKRWLAIKFNMEVTVTKKNKKSKSCTKSKLPWLEASLQYGED
jgi:hypothetical protein